MPLLGKWVASGYAGLHGAYRHHPVVQGEGKNAERLMPIVHNQLNLFD